MSLKEKLINAQNIQQLISLQKELEKIKITKQDIKDLYILSHKEIITLQVDSYKKINELLFLMLFLRLTELSMDLYQTL